MKFELFVALRYLFARRKQAFIYIISIMSIVGVAIGVAALVVVFGVYNGFTTDIRDRLLGANAHIIATGNLSLAKNNASGQPSSVSQTLESINTIPGVTGATPFVYAEGMLSSPRGVKGIILRGIDPQTGPDVLAMLNNLPHGSAKDLAKQGTPGVIVGQELAARLGLFVGSRVNLLSPAGQKTAAGFQPRIRSFVVAGIFHTGMYEYDSSLAFVSLDAARNLLDIEEPYISGIEVRVADLHKADELANAVASLLAPGASVRSWMNLNANLFAALELEKIGMFIVLAMIVLVGSFSIVTTLVMLVMEKTRDIAILMSMGATRGMIRRIFMLQGTIIGFVGTMLGYICGITLAFLLQRYQFIKLPPGVYAIDHLPVLLRWQDVTLVGVSAMVLCFLATIYPARQAASLQPAEALRYE